MTPSKDFLINEPELFRKKALIWANSRSVAAYFTGNGYKLPFGAFPEVLAVDAMSEIKSDAGNALEQLEEYLSANKGFCPGFFSYDLKNELEDLCSKNPKRLAYPDLYFFRPVHLLWFSNEKVRICSEDPDAVFNEIQDTPFHTVGRNEPIYPLQQMSREEYLEKAGKLRSHIIEGDIYEVNFCLEFLAENIGPDPIDLFLDLTEASAMPFSAFFKVRDLFICCGSPERFLQKSGAYLLSQPMKGTARRGKTSDEDVRYKLELFRSEKERAENMMIVDLVRNDLSRSCVPGTVRVEELFGIYSFPHVHQMVSTVSGRIRPDVSPLSCIKNAFPMGSMTGAPKIRAMQLIDQYENNRRGLFSGACGYFTAEGDFDFNVIIRSLIVDRETQKLSCHFGSALTFDSDPEKEYEECLLKAERIMKILSHAEPEESIA